MKPMHLLFFILCLQLSHSETTFFDNPDETFIMDSITTTPVSPGGTTGGGTTEGRGSLYDHIAEVSEPELNISNETGQEVLPEGGFQISEDDKLKCLYGIVGIILVLMGLWFTNKKLKNDQGKKILMLVLLLMVGTAFAGAEVGNFAGAEVGNEPSKEIVKVGEMKIEINKSAEIVNSYIITGNEVKIQHDVLSKPKTDLIYALNYTGRVAIDHDWINYNDLLGGKSKTKDKWKKDKDSFILESLSVPFVTFEDGSSFDFTDIHNISAVQFKEIRIYASRMEIDYEFNKSNIYPIFIDPVAGNGTLQNCITGAVVDCIVNQSSTLPAGNYGDAFTFNTLFIGDGVTINGASTNLFLTATTSISNNGTIEKMGGTFKINTPVLNNYVTGIIDNSGAAAGQTGQYLEINSTTITNANIIRANGYTGSTNEVGTNAGTLNISAISMNSYILQVNGGNGGYATFGQAGKQGGDAGTAYINVTIYNTTYLSATGGNGNGLDDINAFLGGYGGKGGYIYSYQNSYTNITYLLVYGGSGQCSGYGGDAGLASINSSDGHIASFLYNGACGGGHCRTSGAGAIGADGDGGTGKLYGNFNVTTLKFYGSGTDICGARSGYISNTGSNAGTFRFDGSDLYVNETDYRGGSIAALQGGSCSPEQPGGYKGGNSGNMFVNATGDVTLNYLIAFSGQGTLGYTCNSGNSGIAGNFSIFAKNAYLNGIYYMYGANGTGTQVVTGVSQVGKGGNTTNSFINVTNTLDVTNGIFWMVGGNAPIPNSGDKGNDGGWGANFTLAYARLTGNSTAKYFNYGGNGSTGDGDPYVGVNGINGTLAFLQHSHLVVGCDNITSAQTYIIDGNITATKDYCLNISYPSSINFNGFSIIANGYNYSIYANNSNVTNLSLVGFSIFADINNSNLSNISLDGTRFDIFDFTGVLQNSTNQSAPTHYYSIGKFLNFTGSFSSLFWYYAGYDFSSNPAVEDMLGIYNLSNNQAVPANLSMAAQRLNLTTLAAGEYALFSYPSACLVNVSSAKYGVGQLTTASTNLSAYEILTLNNTCTHTANNTFYNYTNTGANITTVLPYYVNITSATPTNFTLNFSVPVTLTTTSLGTLSWLNKPINTLYTFATSYIPSISQVQTALELPAVYYGSVGLYKCEGETCPIDASYWGSALTFSTNATHIIRSGDTLADLSYIITYSNIPETSGGSGAAGDEPTEPVTPPPTEPSVPVVEPTPEPIITEFSFKTTIGAFPFFGDAVNGVTVISDPTLANGIADATNDIIKPQIDKCEIGGVKKGYEGVADTLCEYDGIVSLTVTEVFPLAGMIIPAFAYIAAMTILPMITKPKLETFILQIFPSLFFTFMFIITLAIGTNYVVVGLTNFLNIFLGGTL